MDRRAGRTQREAGLRPLATGKAREPPRKKTWRTCSEAATGCPTGSDELATASATALRLPTTRPQVGPGRPHGHAACRSQRQALGAAMGG